MSGDTGPAALEGLCLQLSVEIYLIVTEFFALTVLGVNSGLRHTRVSSDEPRTQPSDSNYNYGVCFRNEGRRRVSLCSPG